MKTVRMEFMRNPTQISLTISSKVEIRSVRDEIQSARDQIRELEVKMTRSIYFVNLIQFLAIVGAILAICRFLRK
jgi:hypothetical protein